MATMVFPVLRMDSERRAYYAVASYYLHAFCAALVTIAAIHTFIVSLIASNGVAQLMHHQSAFGYTPFLNTPLQFIIAGTHIWGAYLLIEQRHNTCIHKLPWIMVRSDQGITAVNVVYVMCDGDELLLLLCVRGGFLRRNATAQGMKNYQTVLTDKSLIDRVQVYFQCCAINGYQDWLQGNTTNLQQAKVSAPSSVGHWSHCTSSGCLIPPSCCHLNQLKCSPNIAIRNVIKNMDIGKQKAQQWFYSEGCVENVSEWINPLSMFIISFANFIVQLISLVISQISATAEFVARECSALMGDAEITVPAWILPFPSSSPDLLVKRCKRRIAQHRDFEEESFAELSGIKEKSEENG
ncbi:unnamed protein product [Toxocara canis]|uniref:Uncharacterized protein n=1 Tax=Toxocara canis TaxID=6265 RepID=A0A3P7GS65_TOXCA|nr:unnamed protein product [Toxocara canis]